MKHYLDYKATVWFRIPINSKEDVELVKNKLFNGETPSDLYNDEILEVGQCELLYDTEEFMLPVENDNQSTIELYEIQKIDNCTQPIMIWDNTKK
jgi:hypothetical protein